MIKRLVCVLTLLVASSVSAQEVIPEQLASSSVQNIERPVVTVVSATGSVETTLVEVTHSTSTLSAEAEVETELSSTSTSTVIENGAFGTSSTSTVSTTIETTEVEDTQTPTEEDKLFAVVYKGFEEFVEKFFGWE